MLRGLDACCLFALSHGAGYFKCIFCPSCMPCNCSTSRAAILNTSIDSLVGAGGGIMVVKRRYACFALGIPFFTAGKIYVGKHEDWIVGVNERAS